MQHALQRQHIHEPSAQTQALQRQQPLLLLQPLQQRCCCTTALTAADAAPQVVVIKLAEQREPSAHCSRRPTECWTGAAAAGACAIYPKTHLVNTERGNVAANPIKQMSKAA
jgi:hypothetical protein